MENGKILQKKVFLQLTGKYLIKNVIEKIIGGKKLRLILKRSVSFMAAIFH